MTLLVPGANVRHPDYGLGRVIQVLGQQTVIDFFGDQLTVDARTLEIEETPDPVPVPAPRSRVDKVLFRRAYEAVNLGVVPPHPDQLLALSIGGELIAQRTGDWLDTAPKKGLCKVIFGDYGLGKSHHLKMIEACALRQGWVVSFLELDPKQVDPAKPHLVYRALTAALRFPTRGDGSRIKGFFDLVGEVRQYWQRIAPGKYFRGSEWFEPTMTVLRAHPHVEEQRYREGVDWLSGQISDYAVIRNLAAGMGARVRAPRAMPRIMETADIYVQHLVVINEWCRSLGYKGLLILLDEAEHVRGFSVARRDRATNLFDLLARCGFADTRHPAREQKKDPGYPGISRILFLFAGQGVGSLPADAARALSQSCWQCGPQRAVTKHGHFQSAKLERFIFRRLPKERREDRCEALQWTLLRGGEIKARWLRKSPTSTRGGSVS